MADDGADQRILPGAAETAIGQAVQVPWGLYIGAVGIEHQPAGFCLHDCVGGDEVGPGGALGEQSYGSQYTEIGHAVGDQRTGRSVAVGQDLHVEPGLGVEAFRLGDIEPDMVCVRRPV